MDSRSHSARKRSRTAETTLAPSAPRSESTATATAIINTGTFTATKVLKTSHSRTSSTSTSAGGSMSTSMSMSNPGNHHLLNEIDKLKTEITNVNSQRKIDKIQLTNKAKRLQRHILALEQDVQDSNELTQELEAIRDQKDLELERVTRMRDGLQQAYWDLKDGNGNDNGIEGDVVGLRNDLLLEQKKNEFMNEKVNALLVEIEMLKDLKGNQENVNVDPSSAVPTTPGKELTPADAAASSPSFTSLVSPAPPAVLSELNRTRVQLAEAERITRQQKRTMANLQSQADQMIQYRQAANNQKETVTKLESELKSVRRERDGLRVVEGRWVEMRKELLRYNLGSDILTVDSNIDTSGSVNDNTGVGVGTSKIDSENIPPEIATVMRKFQTLHQQVHKLQTETTSLRTKHDHAQNRIQELNQGYTKLQTDQERSHDKQVECKSQLAKALMELRTIQKKEKVWKREAEGMRSLLDTYEQMEDNMAKQGKTKTEQQKFESVSASASASSIGTSSVSVKYESKANTNATIQGLQLSLSTSQDEIKILKEQLETSNSEKDVLQTKLASLQSEHETVRSKFIKLRSALMEAREKVSKAEDRAAKAETLAGKGSFSNSTTRVLHLPDNPLSKAIRTKYESEIEGLKAELLDMANLVNVGRSSTAAAAATTTTAAAAANSNTSMLSSSDPALDAEKFSKRLKDQFREQISLFREGVHIITGYKIDMNLTDPDAPRFAVRSMFAERESDQLNLLWRKDKYGKLKSSMDILDSELAQLLFKEPSFEYMRKFSSLPAFTASVCLSLFEKQTLMI